MNENSPMNSSKDTLAGNIRAMIEKDDPVKKSVNGWAKSKKLVQKKVDRIVKAETAVSLDTLDELAEALGIMAWQLLIPGLDTSNPPHLAVTSTELALYQRLKDLAKS